MCISSIIIINYIVSYIKSQRIYLWNDFIGREEFLLSWVACTHVVCRVRQFSAGKWQESRLQSLTTVVVIYHNTDIYKQYWALFVVLKILICLPFLYIDFFIQPFSVPFYSSLPPCYTRPYDFLYSTQIKKCYFVVVFILSKKNQFLWNGSSFYFFDIFGLIFTHMCFWWLIMTDRHKNDLQISAISMWLDPDINAMANIKYDEYKSHRRHWLNPRNNWIDLLFSFSEYAVIESC